MVAQTRGGGSTSITTPTKLQFKEKLSTKTQTTDILLKKLQSLRQELSQMEQERVDVKSLAGIRKELIHSPLLLHKDKGVKVYVACCLADILRLFAPDAPYTAEELRDIFQFFFRQLSTGLKGASSSYYNEYFQLLESLATVKSVVLVCDLPHADELTTEIFNTLFTLVRNELPRNTELCMSEILVALIDECQTLPHGVLEILMNQFQDQSARMDQPAYRLAVVVCNGAADKLQRYVCQYFTDIIVQHSKDDDFIEIRTAHELIKKINRDCSSLLHNVVPQLEEELKVSEMEVRLLATQVLGEMFADKGGAELTKKYPHVWESWLAKKYDKAPVVRIAFVEACKGIITNHPELRDSVEEGLRTKFYDGDEKVRAATCKLYSQLDYETALHHVTEEQLRHLAERCRDKRPSVSREAMNAIGKLYSLARSEMDNNEEAAIKRFSWMPQAILLATTAINQRTLVEETLGKYILPLPGKDEDDSTWADQLLSVMRYLDEKATTVLLGLSTLLLPRPSLFQRYVQICEDYNGGVMDKNEEATTRNLNMVIRLLAGQFLDQSKASNDLQAFGKVNEARLYKLLKICMDVQTDIKALAKSTNEFLRRIEQVSPTIVDTMSAFLRKCSLWILNTSSIPSFLKHLQEMPASDGDEAIDAEGFARCSKVALNFISKRCPSVFKRHVHDFSKSLAYDNNPRLVEMALQALSAIEWTPNDKHNKERIVQFARSDNPRHAKFAVRIIRGMKDSDGIADKLVDAIAESLPKVDEDSLVGHLTALAQIVTYAPNAFERQSETIIGFIVKDILMQPAISNMMDSREDKDLQEEWCLDSEVTPLTKSKLLGIKICRNRCVIHGQSESAHEVGGNPVLKMLLAMLTYGGSMTDNAIDDPKVKSRMRLIAATSLLRMATVPAYSNIITLNYMALAITMQDPCFQVRMGFLSKLITYLTRKKTDMRFNAIVFLTAHDPEREVRDKTRNYVSHTMVQAKSTPENRLMAFETTILRLIHTLAHHPDFSRDEDNLKDTAKYIEFYLDNIATVENVSLLYHLAMKIKSVRDIVEDSNENLYCVSELAQEIIRNRAKLNGWQLTTYPGKVKLMPDIFKVLPNADIAKKIQQTVYLPAESLKWLSELGKTAGSPNSRGTGRGTTANNRGSAKVGRKRKSPSIKHILATKKPQKRKRRKSYDNDEEEDEGSEIESFGDSEANGNKVQSDSSDGQGDEDVDGQGEEDQLGRGARGRAKRRARREARKQMKEKSGT